MMAQTTDLRFGTLEISAASSRFRRQLADMVFPAGRSSAQVFLEFPMVALLRCYSALPLVCWACQTLHNELAGYQLLYLEPKNDLPGRVKPARFFFAQTRRRPA